MKLESAMLVGTAAALVFLTACMVADRSAAAESSTQDDLVARAERARQQGKLAEAVELATKAIQVSPQPGAFMIRGLALSEMDKTAEALADFDRALELDPKVRGAQRQRGRELFKLGRIDQSLAAFDKYVELEPAQENGLWERGLTRYYAGQFAAAQKSFEDYHKVGPEDIENGLWRMLSQAEVEGLPAAQKALLKYEPKRRPPFPLLYDLYNGSRKPADVEAHALDGAANEADKRTRTFYLHLYVGLWFVVNKDRAAAVQELEKAVALRSTDYMWYVARHQLTLLTPSGKP